MIGLILVASPLTLFGVVRAQGNARRSALRRDLDLAILAFHGSPSLRPVLRSPATDADTTARASWAQRIDDRTLALPAEPSPDAWVITPTVHGWMASLGPQLAALRDATHGRAVHTHIVPGGSLTPPEGTRAQRLLLFSALEASPAECPRIAADAVRSLEDHSRAMGVVGLALRARFYARAAAVVRRCPAGASRDELTASAQEFAALADNAPSPAAAIRDEVMIEIGMFLATVATEPQGLPHSVEDVTRVWYLSQAAQLCQQALRALPRVHRATWDGPSPTLPTEAAALQGLFDALPESLRPMFAPSRYLAAERAGVQELRDTAAWLTARAAEAR